jgi:hypothetical protein
MHIYNWYHSNVAGIHYVHEYRLQCTWRIPLAFYLPLLIPFCPLSDPSLLTWNPPSCDRIRPPWSQVACKLTSPFPTLSPIPPPFQIPRTQAIKCLTMMTSGIRRLLSRAIPNSKALPLYRYHICNPVVHLLC